MRTRLTQPSLLLAAFFAIGIALGTCLLMLPMSHAQGHSAPFITALFTATSAVSITGLVVVDTAVYWSRFGQVVIMVLFQLGGLGMMTAATLLGLLLNQQLRTRTRLLLQAETRTIALGDVRSVIRLVLLITVTVELCLALVLAARFAATYGMEWRQAAWHGLFHAVSAFNNAGFSTLPEGLLPLRRLGVVAHVRGDSDRWHWFSCAPRAQRNHFAARQQHILACEAHAGWKRGFALVGSGAHLCV
jgi:trk system potassium uptake protein